MAKRPIDIKAAVAAVEDHPDYRLLRRINEDMLIVRAPGENDTAALYVDIEATGLDKDKHEIIELAMYPFYYDVNGWIISAGPAWQSFNQPHAPITPEITGITGITNDMVRGQYIDWKEVEEFIGRFKLVVAHNAYYDRGFLEKACSAFEWMNWACSQTQVPWKENGIRGTRLEYIVMDRGYFYDAHRADIDCVAGVFSLMTMLNNRPAIAHLLENAREEGRHLWALRAPFETKDDLKARGYQWSGGDNGQPKAWHKEVAAKDELAELEWLGRNVYSSVVAATNAVRSVRVTARNRFTDRIF